MTNGAVFATLSALGQHSCGDFRARAAVEQGVSRRQIGTLVADGALERLHPDTYRMTAVAPSNAQSLWAAVLWAGHEAAAAGVSAGELYAIDGIRAVMPEIVVPGNTRLRSPTVIVHRSDDHEALMIRKVRGLRVTGIEATLVSLARTLDAEHLERACEDARRRGSTSVPALRTYVERFGGRPGTVAMRRLLDDLDPANAARSALEVRTRRLLVANGFTDFVREFPLTWNGRTYWYDFCFEGSRTILETNGRRWHDDPADYEHDNEKWSVPARCGYRIVFATWSKVSRHGGDLLSELAATMRAVA